MSILDKEINTISKNDSKINNELSTDDKERILMQMIESFFLEYLADEKLELRKINSLTSTISNKL